MSVPAAEFGAVTLIVVAVAVVAAVVEIAAGAAFVVVVGVVLWATLSRPAYVASLQLAAG